MPSSERRAASPLRASSNLEVAKSYLARGWSVLPVCPPDHTRCSKWHSENCRAPGKAPLVAWQPYQTELPTDDDLATWFDFWPNANIGVACGPVSKLIAIDVDGEAGITLLNRFKGEHTLPRTLEFATGKPKSGRLLYSIPDGHPAPLWPLETPEGEVALTIIGQGGQTVMPPSRHASGNDYTWYDEKVELAVCPDWLLERLKAREEAMRSGETSSRAVDDGGLIKLHGRNTTLTVLGGAIRRHGCTETEIRVFLSEVNHRCDPPLHQAEVNKIARSVARYAPTEVPGFRQLVEQTSRPAAACVISMEDVEPEVTNWVWPNFIPFGMLTCIDGDGGVGKALELSTLIPTPSGWTTMGEIQPGDEVFDETGAVCQVVAATEVMHGRPCYRVTFSDGTQVVADAQHQWATTNYASRIRWSKLKYKAKKRRRPLSEGQIACIETDTQIVTTEEIAETLRNGKHANHAVALAGALELPDQDLPIDPYTLGVWLGDGRSDSGIITKADRDETIIDRIRTAGYEVQRTVYNGKPNWRVTGLTDQLRKAGVINNKHVPAEYLRADKEQRLALLQGLMDTDGTAYKTGQSEFTNTRHCIAQAVYELAASLGWKPHMTERRAKLNGVDMGPCWDVEFTPEGSPFSLDRKASRTSGQRRKTQRWRYIVSCDPIPSVPVRCIQVDSPSHLYLITEAMIPTHNSTAMIDILARITRGEPMPDGSFPSPWPQGQPQNVLLVCCEDALAQTIRPRIDAAGGDVKRFLYLEEVADPRTAEVRGLEFPRDMDTIAAVITDNDVKIVVIDPILAFLGAENDYSRDQDVRRAVGRFKRIAEEKGCSIVYIRHWNKGSQGSKASYRGGGSLAWANLARSQIIVGHNPEQKGYGEWHLVKYNLTRPQEGLGYKTESTSNGSSRVVWTGKAAHTAEEVANGKLDEDREPTSDPLPESCTAWLKEFLSSGSKPAAEVREEANSVGWGISQLLAATKELKVISIRTTGPNGYWTWSLNQQQVIGDEQC